MRIFVVEDDAFYGETIAYQLALNPDYEVIRLENAQECLSNMGQQPDAISLDYSLPDMSGDRLMKKLKQKYPRLPVIILSGQEDISTAVDLLKEGAEDYIIKNGEAIDRLRHTLNRIREKKEMQAEIENLQAEVGKKYDYSKVIKGNSDAIQKVFAQMDKAASSSITVSITGETGTGKELVAKSVHYHSARKKGPFVAVNVAAIPKELIESELFGYEKGAFTGAVNRKIGKFEQASKGSLFLDEIGEMDQNMQSKLLRVLQEREITRLGGNTTIKVDFRLILATHKKLIDEVQQKRFREDLFYRLLGLSIELPPLRERKEDIVTLAEYFVKEYARQNKVTARSFTPAARRKLLGYPFPGNIRELRAVAELAMVMAEGEQVDEDALVFQQGDVVGNLLNGQHDTLRGYICKIVKHYLEMHNNNYDEVAKKLDMGKSTLYKMRKDGEI